MTRVLTRVLIGRGLPGSGKSHHLVPLVPSEFYFSTDLFWGPNYNFDPTKLKEAHGWTFYQYLTTLRKVMMETNPDQRPPLLIVDNTNISAYEIAPYVQAATAYGLEHEIRTMWCDPIIAFQRHQHKVPPQVFMKMYQKLLTEELPPFWNHNVIFPSSVSKERS